MKIGFIGCGNMTRSIVAGMLAQEFNARDILVHDLSKEAMNGLNEQHGVIPTSLATLATTCEIIILAVKPQHITQLSTQLISHISANSTIVSILAGVTTDTIHSLLGITQSIRVMPNTPAMIGKSASALFATAEQHPVVEQIFQSIGYATWVEKESDIDIVTALSGSGPAYFFSFFEAMIATATNMGLDRHTATQLCLHTAIGAGELALATSEDLATLRENVTSKGGTTEAALQSFTHDEMGLIIEQAMQSAYKRALELSAK